MSGDKPKLVVDNEDFLPGEDPDTVLETLYASNFRDPAAMLRKLADGIEKEEYGPVQTCAVALWAGGGLEIFGYGPDSDAGNVVIVLNAAVQKMINAVLEVDSNK